MCEELKILVDRLSEVSVKDCDDNGNVVKKYYANLRLKYGKIDAGSHKELSEILVRFATDLLIEARDLERKDWEED